MGFYLNKPNKSSFPAEYSTWLLATTDHATKNLHFQQLIKGFCYVLIMFSFVLQCQESWRFCAKAAWLYRWRQMENNNSNLLKQSLVAFFL